MSAKFSPDSTPIAQLPNEELIKVANGESGKKAQKARNELVKRGVEW